LREVEADNRLLKPECPTYPQYSYRHGKWNPRVVLNANVIQVSSQLNPEREIFLTFLVNRHQTRILAKRVCPTIEV